MTPETKATQSGEINEAMFDLLNSFEAFKEANDQRLDALEGKSRSDVLIDEKVDRLDAALSEQKQKIDRLMLSASRPAIGAATGDTQPSEHKQAFDRYVRAGEVQAMRSLDRKSLSVGSDPDGGYLAPEETESMITAAVRDLSPMRQIASVRQIGANSFRKPVTSAGLAAGWVGETDARPETASPVLSAVDFPTMELYAMPATTQALLDDAIVNVEQWIADEVQAEFAAQEGAAFINGDGVNQPKGLLDYPVVDDASQSWGSIGAVNTGIDGDFGANPLDNLIDLVYAPSQIYRANGRFLMNRSVVSTLRKVKDSEGNYLWQPATQAGAAPTLIGYPVTEAEDMPTVSTGSTSIAFGDFARAYLIVDRVGIRVLRDPFSAKPYVLFYTTKRVGGGVQHFDAVKLLRFAA